MKRYKIFFFLLIPTLVCAISPKSSLVAHYPFNGNADDFSGFQKHGIIGGATPSKDRFGNENGAFYFDGIDDFIMLPESILTDEDQMFTLTFWFQSFSDTGTIIRELQPDGKNTRFSFSMEKSCWQAPGSGHSGCETMLSLNHYNSNCVQVDKETRESSAIQYVTPNWFFVSLILNYKSDTTVQFCDGFSRLQNLENCSMIKSGKICVGYNGVNSFRGNFDDLRIYNKVLSTQDLIDIKKSVEMVATSDKETKEGFLVYPNPSGSRNVKISYSPNEYFINVYSATGQLVYKNVDTNYIDFSKNRNGVYIIQMINKTTGEIYTNKLLIY